jgi:outer membrane protein/adhesin transport system outer membrane protein
MSRVIQKRVLASLPLVVLLTASFGAGAAQGQTLADSLAAAYQTNPTLLAERANLRSIDEHLPQALSEWRPTVQITASAGRTNYNETGIGSFYSSPLNGALQITQPLYVGSANPAIARSKDEIQAERARLFDSEQTVLLNVATAYFNLLRDQATLDLQVKNEQVLSTQLDATRDRFQVGEVTRTDVSQAEAALAGAVASRINAEGNLAVSRASFLQVVGIPAGVVRPVDAPEALLPKTVDEATQTAATDNPQVVAAQFDENAARNHVGELIGGLLPSAQLVASYNSLRQSSAAAGFFSSGNVTLDTASITAQVTVPLYESGSIYSQVRAQKQVAAKARTTIDINRRQAIQSAQAAYQSLVSARAQITSLRAQIEASTVALEGVRQEANVGSRTVLDILNAEQLLVNSQVTLVQSQRDSLVAAYTLLDAVGRLTAKSLGLAVPLYDYEAYFREYKNAWWGTEIDDQ